MFPQLGPSVGFLLATLSFWLLAVNLSDADFQAWGWRLPFLASGLLVAVGLYVRLKLAETPEFSALLQQQAPLKMPLTVLLQGHLRAVLLGALAMVVCYTLFYTATVFCLSYGTNTLAIPRPLFLGMKIDPFIVPFCHPILYTAVETQLVNLSIYYKFSLF